MKTYNTHEELVRDLSRGSDLIHPEKKEVEELWFREVRGWTAKTAREYLTRAGYIGGDLVMIAGGWSYTTKE